MTLKNATAGTARARGRPKAFDRDVAVQAAMQVFWDGGYEGSSFDDLATAMRINPSSFRNTFKTKEALYREATEMYVAQGAAWLAGVLSGEKDVRAAFSRLFTEAAARYTSADHPLGCMISVAGTHFPQGLSALSEMLTTYRFGAEKAMVERLKQGQHDKQLPPDANIHAIAAFFHALFRGMAVQARDGVSRDRLLEIVAVAMSAFPSAPMASESTGPRGTRRR
jgi:AcrR family transcriptional regulator